jgi:hypothetical protein
MVVWKRDGSLVGSSLYISGHGGFVDGLSNISLETEKGVGLGALYTSEYGGFVDGLLMVLCN